MVFCIILFLFYFLDGVSPRLFDHLLWFLRCASMLSFLNRHLSWECVISWLFVTGIMILNLDWITHIVKYMISCCLVHHRHASIETIIASQAQCCKIIFVEITLFLHLIYSGKHCSFLLLSLSSYCETSFKHLLLLIHELLSSRLVILNLGLYLISLVRIDFTYTVDILELGLPLEELHFFIECILPFSLLLCSLQRPFLLFASWQQIVDLFLLVLLLLARYLKLVLLFLLCSLFLGLDDYCLLLR